MRVIYVAHPLGHGEDRESNRRNAAEWAGWIAETFNVAISADWIVLSGVWTEDKRELGLATDLEMVSRADEVWQVGPCVSPGMKIEGEHARKFGKVVRDFTGWTREDIVSSVVARTIIDGGKQARPASTERRQGPDPVRNQTDADKDTYPREDSEW